MKRTLALSLIVVAVLVGSIGNQVAPEVSFIQVAYAVQQAVKDCSSIPQFDTTFLNAISIPRNLTLTKFSIGSFTNDKNILDITKLVASGHFDYSDSIQPFIRPVNYTYPIKNIHVDFSFSLGQFHLNHNETKASLSISNLSFNATSLGKTYQNGTLISFSPTTITFNLPSLSTEMTCK